MYIIHWSATIAVYINMYTCNKEDSHNSNEDKYKHQLVLSSPRQEKLYGVISKGLK